MGAFITADQRDALYDQILDRMSGIGDIELALQLENYDAAERLGQEYSDDLLLLLNDLGLGQGTGESVELTTDPKVLRRTMIRLRDLADGHSSGLDSDLAEANRLRTRNRLVIEACEETLRGIGRP